MDLLQSATVRFVSAPFMVELVARSCMLFMSNKYLISEELKMGFCSKKRSLTVSRSYALADNEEKIAVLYLESLACDRPVQNHELT